MHSQNQSLSLAGMKLLSLNALAVPLVLCLISFLAFSSQYLFLCIDPRPLNSKEYLVFNLLISCLLICYFRSIQTDPGRTPPAWGSEESASTAAKPRQRWCRKCNAYKPPRAHHCKVCGRSVPNDGTHIVCTMLIISRCIPKMDHHCPWTANCVSHRTFPHFLRFVLYCVAAMSYLEYFLYIRSAVIWDNRHWPSVGLLAQIQLVSSTS